MTRNSAPAQGSQLPEIPVWIVDALQPLLQLQLPKLVRGGEEDGSGRRRRYRYLLPLSHKDGGGMGGRTARKLGLREGCTGTGAKACK